MSAQVEAAPAIVSGAFADRAAHFAPWARRGVIARLAVWSGSGAVVRLGPNNVLLIGIGLWMAGALAFLLSR